MRYLLLCTMCLVLCACERQRMQVEGCASAGELVPLCGFFHPEDLELLPDGTTLLISQMGAMDGSTPGSLALFDTAAGTITRLPQFSEAATTLWGTASCTTPPGAAFSPHGIDLVKRADGAWQLLAVNHGGRESVELFELLQNDRTFALQWRGCVLPPPGTYMNDVAAIPGQEAFVVSHMFARDAPVVAGLNVYMLKGMLGLDTGYALRCDAQGCTRLAGTDAPFPNGVQVDATGSILFLNAYMADEVRKIALADGRLLGTAQVKAPDNSQWNAAGKLLVASHTASALDMQTCFGITEGACAAAFEIVEIDPGSMQTRSVFAHSGPPMGAATVAQQVGDMLYLGSFSGDRILQLPYPLR
jgi:hypothetical protein